jgi:anti-sigma regulatory factor (Ser/Thr protein kinase)
MTGSGKVRTQDAVPPIRPLGPVSASGEFSAETMGELVRALRARAADHPESPGLIASWPGVPESCMPAACGELRRRGYAVREVSIARRGAGRRSGWAMGGTTYRAIVRPAPLTPLADDSVVLVREIAEPAVLRAARAAVTSFAAHEGASEAVCSALAIAVTEACANVVTHAYVDEVAPGYLEVRTCMTDAVLVVDVADEGRGMVPRIDSPGLGLGLALIAQVADVLEILDERERPGVVVRMHFNLAGPPATDR